MKHILTIFAFLFLVLSCTGKKNTQSKKNKAEYTRYVEGNIFISDTLPEVKIRIDNDFEYEGSFDFEIIANSEYPLEFQGKPVAAGDRYVFSCKEDYNITKLFIIQLEGFLATNDFIFNYNFDNAEAIGNNKYRYNTWFYNSKKQALENPNNEGAKTRAFLTEKGYDVPDEFMLSRYVGLASKDRKYEIIIFYIEMMKNAIGYSLDEYENSMNNWKVDSIKTAFTKRSKNSFQIIKR